MSPTKEQMTHESGNQPRYFCSTEVKKPHTVLVHKPGLETMLAVRHPNDWGFDPSLAEYRQTFGTLAKRRSKRASRNG